MSVVGRQRALVAYVGASNQTKRAREASGSVAPHIAVGDGEMSEQGGAVTSEAIPREFPPVVYLPCAEQVIDAEDARVDMRETRDGRIACLAYSALDRLHTCCGDDQPWVLMATKDLDQLQVAHPFELLLLDVVIPEDKRRGAGE